MRKTFIIHSKEQIERLSNFLLMQPEKPLLEVVVSNHKKDRSALQNSLYWMWITIIADELGWLKEDVHSDLKKRILLRIYERDDDGYASMINTVRKLHTDGFKQDSKKLADQIIKLTSTVVATTKQFTEYLNEVERDMLTKGISLPHPEDRYQQAMGIKPK